ncbi:MAG: DUF6494 family protein [SAR324 cluster bacterium]|nr:DUF6494 family protein [SAR324 cluster bacterium]
MNADTLNIKIRKFLKEVGVTSQRMIEQAVGQAISGGGLSGSETLKARMVLTVEGIDLRHEIEGEIRLS